LGLSQVEAGVLREHLAIAARTHEAQPGESEEFGDRYIVDFDCVHEGRGAVIRSEWVILHSGVMKSFLRVWFSALCGALLVLPNVSAEPVVWTLQNVQFFDGSTASGSFVFDADLDQYSLVNVSVTAGSVNDAAAFNFLSPADQSANVVYLATANPPIIGTTEGFIMSFSPLQLTDAGGTIPLNGILGPCFTAECDIVGPYSIPSSGYVAGVPVSPVVTTTTLPSGNLGTSYRTTLTASGGTGTYVTWTVATGSLPGGLTLNSSTGVISGTPNSTTGSPFTFSVTVTDSANTTSQAKSLSLSVQGEISGALYVPVSPCRVVDTRNPTGSFGGPFLAANGSRNFPIPSSMNCTIPSTAQAYSLNLTVVPHGSLGYVTMWPTGQTQPVVSTLNSLDGRVKANASIVPAGSGGAVSVYSTNDTDVILDINGYFVAPSVSNAESFYPTLPCRLVDTRAGAPSTVSVGALVGGTSRTLPLLSSSCDVPATVTAYSLNFTVVPSNATLGYLTVYPTGVAQPVVSTLNAPTGTVVANAAIIPAGTAGSIDVYATDTTDLIVDVDGYFAPPGAGGLSFYPLSSCRVLDSRNPPGTPPFNNSINVDVIDSGCTSATAAQAYVFNATVVPSGGSLGYLTLYPEGSALPLASTLNALDGSVTSNMAIVPANSNSISAYANSPAYLILDTSGYFAP
jgi:hypothetical protein